MSAGRNGAAHRINKLCPQCVGYNGHNHHVPRHPYILTRSDRAIIVLLQQMAPFPRDIERGVESVSAPFVPTNSPPEDG